ncbi:MAG: phage protease [Chloroflexota bacterium]|nr:phage protease [Chloroflexota bacterium]
MTAPIDWTKVRRPRPKGAKTQNAHRFALFTEAPIVADDWLQIFPIGSYRYSDYGEVKITPERAERFAGNFRDNVRGHVIPVNREHEQALGAIGWYNDVEARDDGVYARIDWTDEGKDALAAKRFKFFSPEFYDEWIDPKTGETHEDLLVGGALTNYPRFYDMRPVAASEPVREAMKAAADSYEDRRAEVAEALEKRFGYDAYTVETSDDHVVIEWQGEFWSVPHTAAPNGDVTLGIPEEVERVFQPASEMGERGSTRGRVVHAQHELPREGRMSEEATTKTEETKPAAEPKSGADAGLVTMAEFRAAQDDAKKAREEARKANDRLRLMAANDVIDGAKRSGRLVAAEEEFWRAELIGASDEQFTTRAKYLAEKPTVVEFGERGTGAADETSGDDQGDRKGLHERTLKYASEHAADNGGKGISYKDALIATAKKGS